MLEELQRRNFAPTTIATYLHAVEQFARHFRCRPDRLNQTHFRSYQAYLLRERKLRPLTVRIHVAALRFYFVKTLKRRYLLDDTPYPKAPRRLPQILSVEEVAWVWELRHLQVGDIDSRRMLIHIQRGKGGRDRYVPLSPTLLTTLRVYYRWMRPKTWLFPGTVDGWRADKPITPRAARRTSCAIPTPHICWKMARTSGRFSCSHDRATASIVSWNRSRSRRRPAGILTR